MDLGVNLLHGDRQRAVAMLQGGLGGFGKR